MDGQDQNNQNNMNMTGGGEMGGGGKSSTGPIIGIIILLAVVILGGLYFWGQKGADSGTETENTSLQAPNDDVNTIEADLDATEIETLDAEINAS